MAGEAVRDGAWMEAAHADYLVWSERPPAMPGAVQMGEIVAWLRGHLDEDAIITNGAGNYAIWVHRFWRYRAWNSQLAPVSGSMGYGLPAALAAKMAYPERPVVCFAGDGCFQMTMQDFATAVQYGANIIVIVVDNGQYGTIRMHQTRRFPGRNCATQIRNPDFAAFAKACGGAAWRVEKTEDFFPAFEAAERAGRPALIHVKIAPEALGPGIVA
jgi:acetolactate synthase-1/2/3 large subunit